jgi:hypothetical protein
MVPTIVIVILVSISIVFILRLLAYRKLYNLSERKVINHERIEKQIKNPLGALQFLLTDYSGFSDRKPYS